MKHLSTSLLGIFSVLALSINCYSKESKPYLLGEKPPGLTPKLFAPKLLSDGDTFEAGRFSPDMKTFYFTRNYGKYKKRTFFVAENHNNQWQQAKQTDIRWPMFSHDGQTMYLGKEYRKKTVSGWTEKKPIGDFLKEQGHGLTVSSKGTFYFPFFKKEDKGRGNLGYSRLVDGKYHSPINLHDDINQGEYIAHPYIAPDESYLMWDVEREDGLGYADIYISFKQKDGTWSHSINMGEQINSHFHESSPWVSYDGKYLFFNRGDWHTKEGKRIYIGKQYWVDAKVIETLRPK